VFDESATRREEGKRSVSSELSPAPPADSVPERGTGPCLCPSGLRGLCPRAGVCALLAHGLPVAQVEPLPLPTR
jgi:hypothetical protein